MNIRYLSAWRDDEEFQTNFEHEFVVTGVLGKNKHGYVAARRAAEKWSLADGVAIGVAGSSIKLPAICVREFRSLAEENHKKRTRLANLLLMAFLVVIPVIGFIKNQFVAAIGPTILVALTLATFLTDEIFYLRKKNNLAARGRFVYWILNNKKIRYCFAAVLLWCMTLYTLQLCVESLIGGRDLLLEKFGFFYEKVNAGEYWRVFTAPWIHASFFHLANNAMLTACAFPVLHLFCRFRSLGYFFLGALTGQLVQWQIFPVGEVLVGISAGTFALFGAALGICLRYREALPAGIYLKVGYISLITVIAAYGLNPQSAGLAHIMGFSLGLFSELFLHTRDDAYSDVDLTKGIS
jgi:membrane associated rhomboid family serine protease